MATGAGVGLVAGEPLLTVLTGVVELMTNATILSRIAGLAAPCSFTLRVTPFRSTTVIPSQLPFHVIRVTAARLVCVSVIKLLPNVSVVRLSTQITGPTTKIPAEKQHGQYCLTRVVFW